MLLQKWRWHHNVAGSSVPCEHGIICASVNQEKSVLNALGEVARSCPKKDWILQSFFANSVFTRKRS